MKISHLKLFTKYLRLKRTDGRIKWKTWIKEQGFVQCVVCRQYTDEKRLVRQNYPVMEAYTCEEDEQALRDWWGINREGDPK